MTAPKLSSRLGSDHDPEGSLLRGATGVRLEELNWFTNLLQPFDETSLRMMVASG
jgi:hypothetical protein